MQAGRKISKACAGVIKIGALAYAAGLILVLISHLSIFNPNWPYGIFASLLSYFIVVFPVVICALFLAWRKAIPFVTLLALAAFYPFYTFDKMVRPSEQTCMGAGCVSILMANLRHSENALEALSRTEAKDADILIIVEFPYGATSDDLLELFPMEGDAEIGLITGTHSGLGSRIAVVARQPLSGLELQVENFPDPDVRPRGIVKFEYATAMGRDIKFVVVHPPPPKGIAAIRSRDAYLRAAGQALAGEESFVLIGDFNVTPWEPIFDELPGKRAGDPRWTRTWNARNAVERITIDHALIGADISLSDMSVLQDVGSDHLPIHMVIQPKALAE